MLTTNVSSIKKFLFIQNLSFEICLPLILPAVINEPFICIPFSYITNYILRENSSSSVEAYKNVYPIRFCSRKILTYSSVVGIRRRINLSVVVSPDLY